MDSRGTRRLTELTLHLSMLDPEFIGALVPHCASMSFSARTSIEQQNPSVVSAGGFESFACSLAVMSCDADGGSFHRNKLMATDRYAGEA